MYGNHDKKQPDSVCFSCGMELALSPNADMVATWHEGVCGVCHQEAVVTEPRDFGYLNMAWRGHGSQQAA